MSTNRREFLKTLGAGAAFSFLLPLLPKEVLAGIEEGMSGGLESVIKTVCQQCPAGCGLLVRCVGGWPVKISGNPLHPVNRGTLCPLGPTGIFTFYDPDRIRTPLKRVGVRGADQWKAISWEEAIKETVARLLELKDGAGSQLVILDGEYRGLMRTLFEHFSSAFGASDYVPANVSPVQGPVEALHATQNLHAEPCYDIAHAGTLFLFDSDILESSSYPVPYQQAWGKMRRGQKGRRGSVVYIGPRLSPTASKADEWVPVKPGTEGVLALGLAHVLIKESLIDNQFVENNCSGFYGETGLRAFILSKFRPNVVSEVTGVDIPTIFHLARKFIRQKPSVAIASRYRRQDQIAVHSLNALVGSINVQGGVLVPRKIDYGRFEGLNKAPDPLSELITKFSDPYKALFLYYSNPIFSRADGHKFKEAFDKIPFIVSFSPLMDETTSLADLILPDQTFLERWQDVPTSTLDGFPVLGVSQPVPKALYEGKNAGDVLLNIASTLGLNLPWPDFRTMLDEGFKRIFDLGKGDVFGDEQETSWVKLLERSGWWSPAYETLDQFKQLILERGGWWDPSYHFSEWNRVVTTPSGKFEFHSPDMSPSSEGDAEYPLGLKIFKPLMWLKSRTANQPWLSDVAGPHLFERWHTWLEINPETAKKFKISEGEEVLVTARRGKIKATARIYEGIVPDVVALPIGLGHTVGGQFIQGIGSNPLDILDIADGETGPTRVRIETV